MQVTNHSNKKRKMKEEMLEAIYGTVERLEQKVDMLSDLLVKDENNDWVPAYEFERKFLEKNNKSD